MNKKPDRYSVLVIDIDSLPQRITQAEALGMSWMVRDSSKTGRTHGKVALYIFFDEAGMEAYLRNEWGDAMEAIRHNLGLLRSGKMTQEFFIERCADLSGANTESEQ